MLGNFYNKKNNDDKRNRRIEQQRLTSLLNDGNLDNNNTSSTINESSFQVEPPVQQQSQQHYQQDYNSQYEEELQRPYQSSFSNSIDENSEIVVNNPDLLDTSELQEEGQIGLGLDTARVTRISKLRENLRHWENIIEVLPFWKIAINPINITFSIITMVLISAAIFVNFDKLPQDIPLVYSQIDHNWVFFDKSFLAILPIILAVFELVLVRIKRMVFEFDRRLSSVIATTQVFFNIVLIIAVFQIISLVLV